MGRYEVERIGQIDFFNRFLPRIAPNLNINDILMDNNDGVLNGNLLEFKLDITNINSALSQAIKYLSSLRIKGESVPAGIHLIDLNAGVDYYYKSEPYLKDIEKVYIGAASRDNSGYVGGPVVETLHYENSNIDAERVIALLKEKNYIKIHIDENCIVGWAKRFYDEVPNARKEDFIGEDSGKHKTIGEIRNPRHFSELIYPYTGKTNKTFKHLMDCVNDPLQRKNLGAFYTNELYAEKSIELVRQAIARVPAGNNYIILDRCAGTGNLEAHLNDEELSHCIVSTIEYYEYKVLLELIGQKVLHLIPPVEDTDTFDAGHVTGADALSKEYIENPLIKQYIDDPNYTIILFENPPYAETTSIEWHKKGKSKNSTIWKQSYVVEQMKKEVKGAVSNELGNAFIWSAFKYYLRQPTDSYIVYSPVKYWKVQHLVEKEFIDGFAFNRKHFHTNIDACIMCALWSNADDPSCEQIDLAAYDIQDGVLTPLPDKLPVKKIHSFYSKKYYDNRTFSSDGDDGIVVGLNGIEAPSNVKVRIAPKVSPDIIGYMVADSSGFDNPDTHSSLLVAGRYNGNGFFLRRDNYLEKLPMFAASRYITYNRAWTERARIMKSGDGSARFQADVSCGKLKPFLIKCLLFTCMETQNHMRSFVGSDGRVYRNELCLDITNGDTLASCDIKGFIPNEQEVCILRQWDTILSLAKAAEEYDPALTYGIYQIADEIDTYTVDPLTGKHIYNHVELHSALQGMKALVKDYYNSKIVPMLFAYEFLK